MSTCKWKEIVYSRLKPAAPSSPTHRHLRDLFRSHDGTVSPAYTVPVGSEEYPLQTPIASGLLYPSYPGQFWGARSRGRRLGSAQRFVLLLFILDLSIGLGTVFVAILFWSRDSPAVGWVLAPWILTWFLCSAAAGGFSRLGGFSSCREMLSTFLLSIRSGTIALAVCVVIDVFLGHEGIFLQLIVVMASLSLLSGIARASVTRLSSPRILVVSLEDNPAPAGLVPNLYVQHFHVSADLIKKPDLLVVEISEAARRLDATTVEILGDMSLYGQLWRSLAWELREQRTSLRFAFVGGPLCQRRVHCAVRGTRVVLEISAPAPPLATRLAKRCTDVGGALCLLVAFSPLLITLAILVKLTSDGPALYRQVRVGKDGKLFNILKFRTMADGSDKQLQSLLENQKKGDKPLFKIDNDPRVTRVGAVLRRYSLDELPQLFNVLEGSMSLVGPRPHQQAEVALYRGDAAHRLGVLPGMTGLWQVSGRSRLTWEEAQQLDIDYAHNWSLWKDISILARTARAVFGADGAR